MLEIKPSEPAWPYGHHKWPKKPASLISTKSERDGAMAGY